MRSSMYVRRAAVVGTAVGLSLALAACGAMPGERQELRAPNYASPIGVDKWEVNCGRNRIIIDDDSLDEFYDYDGSVKSYMQFCREAEPSAIKRSR